MVVVLLILPQGWEVGILGDLCSSFLRLFKVLNRRRDSSWEITPFICRLLVYRMHSGSSEGRQPVEEKDVINPPIWGSWSQGWAHFGSSLFGLRTRIPSSAADPIRNVGDLPIQMILGKKRLTLHCQSFCNIVSQMHYVILKQLPFLWPSLITALWV